MWSKRWLYAALGAALALPWVPGPLKAQEMPAADPEPSVTVPPLPASPRFDELIQEPGTGAACPPTPGAPFGTERGSFPFVPFMLGDFIGPLANPMTDLKVAEGDSPIPLDRVFYRFNFYSNLNPSFYQSAFAPYKQVNLFTNVFGFEKTFGEWFSFGVRIPINGIEALSRGTFYVRVPGPGNQTRPVPGVPDYRSAQLGNINSIFKIKLAEDRNAGYLVSAGVAISFPTAATQRIDPGPSTATVLQPFLGYLYTRDRFFAQGFGSMTLPMISIQSLILFNDVGLGLWAYRDDSPSAILTGIAPTFEMHLNVPVQGPDRISYIFNKAGTLPFNTQFNLTFGSTFEFFHRATLGLGFVVPTVGPDPFNYEFLAHFNVRF
jgi:hypothetical protein